MFACFNSVFCPRNFQRFGEIARFSSEGRRFRHDDHSERRARASNHLSILEEPRGRTDDRQDVDRGRLTRWRKKQEFHRYLRDEAGLDEAAEKFDRQAPPDSRILDGFLSKEVKQQRGIVQREMAIRKYYNVPLEDNLLTWAAKGQVFELRRSDPEKWTPEQIAEAFPISVESARRMLKRKWPPPPTGENEEEVIGRHDEEVRRRWTLIKKGKTEPGLLSETTLHMIRTGQVKFLPMFAAGNSKLPAQHDSENGGVLPSTITPDDGPFVKLYKSHLQYLESSSKATAAGSTSISVSGVDDQLVSTREDAAGQLRHFVFPEEEPGSENAPVQFEDFRRQLEEALKRRDRPEDRKYREWMAKKASGQNKET